MKIIFYIGVISLLFSCQNTANFITKELEDLDRDSINIGQPNLSSLKDLYQSDKGFYFVRHGICNNNLTIKGNKCVFFFTNQCAYEFTCRLVGHKIEVLWDYDIDCLVTNDLDSIIKSIYYPKTKEAIGAFYVESDSTLGFEAYHEEKLNHLNTAFGKWCDYLFPKSWLLDLDQFIKK
jgi:hypothetical protein